MKSTFAKSLIAPWPMLVLLALALFSSCTLEKKRYSSGYHIDWQHRVAQKPKQDADQAPQKNTEEKVEEDMLVASAEEDLQTPSPSYRASLLLSPKSFAKATAQATKKKIAKHHFGKHFFWQKKKSPPQENDVVAEMQLARKTDTALFLTVGGCLGSLVANVPILGVLTGLIGLLAFVAVIVGFAMAVNCLREIKKEPAYNKYYGKAFAAWLLGLIYICLLALILVLLIAFFALFLAVA